MRGARRAHEERAGELAGREEEFSQKRELMMELVCLGRLLRESIRELTATRKNCVTVTSRAIHPFGARRPR